VVAALVLGRRAGALAVARNEVARAVFVLALAATATGGLLSLALASRVTRPIRRLTDAAQRVSAGDLSARVSPEGSDELAVLGRSFDQMTASISSLTSDLKTAADEERRQRSSLETLLQSLADGVIATDESGMVVAFNREAERILGTAAPSAMGRPVDEVLRLETPDGRLLDGQVDPTRSGEMRASVADGGNPVAVTSAPIRDDSGRVIGGVAVLRDLTSEQEVERMKTNFLSNVSHELRTPLTPIKGYSDILRRTKVPREKEVLYLDGIIEGAEKLERIVEMLIDFSAMEAGRLVVRKGPVDLGDLSTQLVERWTKLAPRHRIERKGFRNLPRLELDRKLVRLAISELIDNAVKFSPDGGKVLISASIAERGREPTEVRIAVADEGIGMTAEQMSGITESFSQVDPSATRAFGGLGLGLAYVKRVAESHGGSLEAVSRPKKGSKFKLVLPAEKSSNGE
ncbi:MAG: sensor histidine kinase, partial [Actinomycetota bacterium]